MFMTQHDDYYKVLGVQETASQDDVKKAFKKLALQCHPDHHPDDPDAESKFKEINEAYGTLSNSDKRKQYDLFKRYGGSANQYRYNTDGKTGRVNVDFGFDVFDSAFDFVFRKNRRQNDPMKGRNLSVPMGITLYELICGVEKKFKFSFQDFCVTCKGTGFSTIEDCAKCHATGMVAQKVNNNIFRYACQECRGTGELPGEQCKDCSSTGKVQSVMEGVIKIETNTSPNKKFIYQSKGGAGLNGGPRGNLIVWLDVEYPSFDNLTEEDKDYLKKICQKS